VAVVLAYPIIACIQGVPVLVGLRNLISVCAAACFAVSAPLAASGAAQSSGDEKLAPTPLAAPGQPGWVRVKDRDCHLWDPNPTAGESVIWTGECEGGFATGIGKEHWFTATGASSNQLEGTATAGKLEGEIRVTYPWGDRYVGKLDASGIPTGFGTLTYRTGLIDRGLFIDGEFVGPESRDTSDRPAWVRIKDRDCSFWDPRPIAGGSITWTGECENGFATGVGKARFFTATGTTSNQLEGTAIAGRFEGEVTVTYPDGSRYVGNLNASADRTGFGTFTYPTGLIDRGFFIDGEFVGPESRDTSDISLINQKAAGAWNSRQIKDTETLYESGISALVKRFGPTHPFVAHELQRLAPIYMQDGQLEHSESLCRSSIDTFERFFGKDDINETWSLIGLGSVYIYQQRYSDAEGLLKQALGIVEQAVNQEGGDTGPNLKGLDSCLNNLAFLYHLQARFSEGEQLQKRALNVVEKIYGTESAMFAEELTNMGALYDDWGRYDQGEPLLNRALDILSKLMGGDDLHMESTLFNLAKVYEIKGNYERAEELLRRSLNIEEGNRGQHPNLVAELVTLAELYINESRFRDAEALLNRALSIDSAKIDAMKDLANLYDVQGRKVEAESLLKRSLSKAESLLGQNHPLIVRILDALAMHYWTVHEYADAENIEFRALAIKEQIFGKDAVAYNLFLLGQTYSLEGRFAYAISFYNSALVIFEKHLDRSSSDNVLNYLAVADNHLGRIGEALSVVDKLLVERKVSPVAGYQTVLSAQKADLTSEGQAFVRTFAIRQLENTAASFAVGRLSQRLAAQSSALAQLIRRDQDLANESAQLNKNLIAALSKPLKERYPQGEEEMRKRLVDITADRRAVQSTLAKEFPNYTALAQPEPLSLPETQALLEDDEAVLAFYIGAEKSYAWTVTKGEGFWTEIPTNAKQLNDQVQELRASLTFNADIPFDAKLAYQIYQQTFGAIADKIAGKRRLSVIASGALTSIPLGMLVTKDPTGKSLKDTDWLIKSFAITVEPSISSIKTMRAKERTAPATKPMIAFADPVFSQKARDQTPPAHIRLRSMPEFYQGTQVDVRALGDALPQLPATRSEVKAVARSVHADSGDLRLGPDATTTAVKESPLDQYRVVYFATHSLVAGDLEKFAKAKAEPALVLSIPEKPTEQDDGLLRASDIAQLKLNADWVVLSACNTASGDGVGAEALSGLAQAFIYAGARSLVVSHWDVNDAAAAKLMSALFSISSSQPELSHGEALQAAEIQLLGAAKTDAEAHPRYWAPFAVVGEPAKPH
jgi:CHAT domain-containing protein/Flp pilus assembly protein TadD